jgi:hypothetical protein
MRSIGAEVPEIPGTRASSISALTAVFAQAGLDDISTTMIEARCGYADFDAFWLAQTPSYSPTTRVIEGMALRDREELMARVRAALLTNQAGHIEYTVTANAVKARVRAHSS